MSRLRSSALLAAAVLAVSCGMDATAPEAPFVPALPTPGLQATTPLRVWDDPYVGINWTATRRLLMQTHDHAANSTRAILAYDSAGYDVMPLMDYSGVASLPYARRRRLWPADSVVSLTARNGRRHITTWAPAAEEVGYQHVVSLFLTEYIAKWEPGQYPQEEAWMYKSTQGAIDLISSRGGFPILAHPWGPAHWTSNLRRYRGIEVYTAYAEQQRAIGEEFFTAADRNQDLLDAWDRSLSQGDLVVGFAVNDHFGPDSRDTLLTPRIRDSGKSIILATDTSLSAIRDAVAVGRVFAVRDFGVPKLQFARIDSLWYSNGVIHIVTNGHVRWIADGQVVAEDVPYLVLDDLRSTTKYVRIEVSTPDGSVVFTQPMRLRPRGDVNGDFAVDSRDSTICANAAASPISARSARACASRLRHGMQ